jgi:2-dehydropantoate 2-reductase
VKILVLGAGGIGGYYGGRLAQAGADVTFLVRRKRREQLERDGLRVESVSGNFSARVKSVTGDTLGPGYDAVLFTCKAYDLDSAMDAIAPAMDGRCIVVPLLNGLAHFEALDARFGRARVMGGTAHINVKLAADGTIVNPDPLQRIIFGERDPSQRATAEALAAEFAKTRVETVHSKDIEEDLWAKIVFLSALASVTCLFRGNVGEIMSAPGGLEAMQRALAANVEIAKREGHEPQANRIQGAMQRLTDPQGTWESSMLRDMEAGNPVEADHIVGWMLRKARQYGIDDTVLSLAYTHLKAYERRREKRRLPKPQ